MITVTVTTNALIINTIITNLLTCHTNVGRHGHITRDTVNSTRTRTRHVLGSTRARTRTSGGRTILGTGSRVCHLHGRSRGRLGRHHSSIRHRRHHLRRGRRALSRGVRGCRGGRRTLTRSGGSLRTHVTSIRTLGGDRCRLLRHVSKLARRRTGRCLLSDLARRLRRSGTHGLTRCRARLGTRTSLHTHDLVSRTVRHITTSRITRAAMSIIPLPGSRVGNHVVNHRNHGVHTVRALANVSLVVSSAPRTVALSNFSPIHHRVTHVTVRHLVSSNHVRPTHVRRVIGGTHHRIRGAVGTRNRHTILRANLQNVGPRVIGLLNHLRCHADCNRGILGRSVRITFLSNVVTDRLNVSPRITHHTNLLRSVNGSISRRIRNSRVRVNISVTGGCGRDSTIVRTVRTRRNSIRTRAIITYLIRTTSTVSTTHPNTHHRGLRGCVGHLRGLRRLTGDFRNIRQSFTVRTNHRIHVVIQPRGIGSSRVIVLTQSVTGGVRSGVSCPNRVGIGLVHRGHTISCTGWAGRGPQYYVTEYSGRMFCMK